MTSGRGCGLAGEGGLTPSAVGSRAQNGNSKAPLPEPPLPLHTPRTKLVAPLRVPYKDKTLFLLLHMRVSECEGSCSVTLDADEWGASCQPPLSARVQCAAHLSLSRTAIVGSRRLEWAHASITQAFILLWAYKEWAELLQGSLLAKSIELFRCPALAQKPSLSIMSLQSHRNLKHRRVELKFVVLL